MPLIFQERVNRADLRANPDRLFLFWDNERRVGLGGQAAECRGEPNAIGVATKRAPSRSPSAYWSDADLAHATALVDADLRPAFAHARRGGTVVCPSAGLGTGLSELPARAPAIFRRIQMRLDQLARVMSATNAQQEVA